MKIAVVLGARPEITKMFLVIRECERLGLDYFILHTGQHYSYSMDNVFFDQLELPSPKHDLEVGSGSHAQRTGRMLMGVEEVFQKARACRITVHLHPKSHRKATITVEAPAC